MKYHVVKVPDGKSRVLWYVCEGEGKRKAIGGPYNLKRQAQRIADEYNNATEKESK